MGIEFGLNFKEDCISFFFDADAAGVVDEKLIFLLEGVLVDIGSVEERCSLLMGR